MKVLEQEYAEALRRHQDIIDAIQDILFVFNQEGKVVNCNRQAEVASGYSKGEILGQSALAFFPEQESPIIATALTTVLQSGCARAEAHLLRKDGTSVPYQWSGWPLRDERGHVTAVAAVGRGCEQYQLTLQILRESEEKYRLLVESTRDAILLVDAETMRILSANSAAIDLYGYCEEEFLTMRAVEISAEADRTRDVIRELAQQEELRIPLRWHRKNDGTVFPVELVAGTFPWKGRKTICAVIRDVSERVRLEEELRRAKDAAESASRAKSEFLDVMSHELRTPLNAVLGFSQLLAAQSCGQLNERQAKYVDHILASGKHLLELVSEILDLVEIESGSMKITRSPFDVVKTIHDMVSRSESWIGTHAAQKGIALKVECAEDLPLIMADQPKFKKILHNLLSNAIKFTDEGGSICLTAHRIADFGLRVVDLLKQGAHIGIENVGAGAGYPRPAIAPAESAIEIVLTDTGVGIRVGDLERIFEKFKQADSSTARRHRGMGLGLAMTRKLIEFHGGYIWAESAGEDQGSTFSFLLPTGLDE
jgi:PAS domain S-box-containing protein